MRTNDFQNVWIKYSLTYFYSVIKSHTDESKSTFRFRFLFYFWSVTTCFHERIRGTRLKLVYGQKISEAHRKISYAAQTGILRTSYCRGWWLENWRQEDSRLLNVKNLKKENLHSTVTVVSFAVLWMKFQ